MADVFLGKDEKGPDVTSIEWKDDGRRGTEKTSWGSSSVAKPQIAVSDAIYEYCGQIVADSVGWISKMYPPYKEYSFAPLKRARPKLEKEEMDRIKEKMYMEVPKFLETLVDDNYEAKDMENFVFLLSLGKKRNWKSGCVICLADKMMGTTCSCGHTEIAVFRPCGHSICASPCFKDFIKEKGIELKPQEITVQGKKFIIPGKLDINSCRGFSCPICKREVEKTFRAEDVQVPKDVINGEAYKKMIENVFDAVYYVNL